MQQESFSKLPKRPEVKGLMEFRVSHNLLGPFFLTNLVNSLKYDDYIRVLDLRNNRFSSAILNDTKTVDFIK